MGSTPWRCRWFGHKVARVWSWAEARPVGLCRRRNCHAAWWADES